MNRTAYFRNDRWHRATELDRPAPEAHDDDSLPALLRWMCHEVRGLCR
jgi:hypothetical protein